MRLHLASTFSATIVGVLVLSILSSLLALYSAWRVEQRLEEAHKETIPSVRGEELQIALLERNALVATYLFDDGNPLRQDRLRELQDEFHHWTATVRNATHFPAEEEALLSRLEKTWADLDATQEETIALYQKGERAKARTLLFTEINGRLSKEAYGLCEQLVALNDRQVKEMMVRADARIHRTALMVGISVLLTIGFAGGLLWLFFYRVIFPLRGMMADAQLFRGGRCDTGKESNEDELHAMGHYLRDLMSDVTDTRSRLERSRNRLLNAEKLASVGKIAASVAHEIRNPLTAMKMWLFSIQEAAEGNADLLGKLAIVSEEIARLEGIVRNFLEFSRPPVIQCQSQDVNLVIDGTLELLGPRLQQAKIAITRASPPGLPAAMADAKQLKQVFINLLGNAADAMCHGGNVDITATVEKDADGRSMVVVRVCDTGSGMPQDVQKRIFEPFFTTKDTGAGLGLCIAAQIMARHGGSLVLESSTEQGTRFAVWVPVVQEGAHGQDPRS